MTFMDLGYTSQVCALLVPILSLCSAQAAGEENEQSAGRGADDDSNIKHEPVYTFCF